MRLNTPSSVRNCTLPVTAASSLAACSRIHSTVGPSMVSALPMASLEKPLVKVSGSTTRSVVPCSGAISSP
jgi:hypothetical protein